MMNTKAFIAATILLSLLMVEPSILAQVSAARKARLLDSYGDTPCDDTLARLDLVAQELSSEPSAKAYIIGYTGEKTGFGRTQHRLKHAQAYLTGLRGVDASRIVLVDGGYQEKLKVDSWLVPEGASPPTPTASFVISVRKSRKFEQGYIDFFKEDNRYKLYCCDICPLEVPDLRGYADLLKSEPGSRAHIFIYFGGGSWFRSFSGLDRRRGGFGKMASLLKGMLVRDYGMDANRLTISYGGKRETLEMELWVVPKGDRAPEATPTYHGRRGASTRGRV